MGGSYGTETEKEQTGFMGQDFVKKDFQFLLAGSMLAGSVPSGVIQVYGVVVKRSAILSDY